MNPADLESILRAAPRPMPPAGLQKKLTRQVQLSPVGAPANPKLPNDGWLKRWWPTLAFGGGILACATALVTQQAVLRNQRNLGATAPIAAAPTITLSEGNSTANAAVTDDRRAEMDRLRAELAALQITADETKRLAAGNQQLRKDLASAEAALPGISAADLEASKVASDRALAIACVNNLKQIGLAIRIWANNHGGAFPPNLLSLKAELGAPKILLCPADSGRQPAVDWTTCTSANFSYEFLAPGGSDQEPTRVATRCLIHGNIGLCDGSVQMSRGDGTNLKSRLVNRDGKLYFQ